MRSDLERSLADTEAGRLIALAAESQNSQNAEVRWINQATFSPSMRRDFQTHPSGLLQARVKNDIRQKQQETMEKMGDVEPWQNACQMKPGPHTHTRVSRVSQRVPPGAFQEQQSELRAAEASRRLGALDLRPSGRVSAKLCQVAPRPVTGHECSPSIAHLRIAVCVSSLW